MGVGLRKLAAEVLYPGEADAPILKLSAPVSFWGAIDPATGALVDPRHPDCGKTVSNTVLAIPSAIGSSSSSAVMLELLRNDVAPAAVLLAGDDSILALGVIIARELGYPTIPILRLTETDFAAFPRTGRAAVRDHTVTVSRPR